MKFLLSVLLLLLASLGPGTAPAAEAKETTKTAADTTPDISQKAYDAAMALHDAGKDAGAEQAFRTLVEARTQALGAEARETLLASAALIRLEIYRGRDTTAASRMQALLPILQRVLGAEDRETLICQRRLVYATWDQGRYAETEQACRSQLLTDTRVLGPEDEETLGTRTILARELAAQGKALEAGQELRAILAIQEKEPGAQTDAATLENYHTLASDLKARNQTAEALTFARRALTGRIKLLGKDANDTDASQRLVNQLTYASPPGPELQALPPKTRPVAMVDGALIYAAEVQQTIAAQQEVIRYQHRNDSDKMEEELAKLSRTPFGGLIDKHLLLNEFRRIGGVIKQESIDDDLNTIIKDSFKGDRDLFLADLSKKGLTFEEFRTLREHMAIMHAMRSRFTGVVTLTDEEVRDYFEKNKQRWLAPEQIKIRTLSIPKTQADARETAASLRKKILGGADFAETARASSQDSHAEDGGAWDWITLSDLSDHVRKAAAKTPKGRLGELIEQENTFIILRVDDRRAPPPPPFEKVKAEVTQALETEEAEQRNAARIKELRDKADIRMLGAL